MTPDVSTLPPPLNVITWFAWLALKVLWWLFITPTRNVAELGPWFAVCYWAAVYGFAHLGAWGAARMHTIRRGADFFEFDPNRRGGAWAGAPVKLIRLQVAGEAWAAGTGVVVGYGGLAFLLTVGLLWRWLPLLVVGLLWWWWRARTRPAWWENGAAG